MLEIAEFAVGPRIVAQGRTAGGDRIGQHVPDGANEALRTLRAGDARGRAVRRNAGAVERLADIDVAEARDHALIEQRCLDRGTAPVQPRRQNLRREFVAERFGAKRREMGIGVEIGFGDQIHEAEAAVIGIDDAGAILHVEDDVVMRAEAGAIARRGMMELAGRQPAARRRMDREAARHAEMDQQHLLAFEAGENVFCAAVEPFDTPPGQSRGEALGQRVAQVETALDGQPDTAALKRGRKAAADGFDFGQFGHFVPCE